MLTVPPSHFHISSKAFLDESEAVRAMLPAVEKLEALEPRIMQSAHTLALQAREALKGMGIETFLQEYGLDTKEGVAIMCLAEALLRIPDNKTADKLIQNTFDRAQWEKHLGQSSSFFVNASSWGLLLTGKIVQLTEEKETPGAWFAGLVARLGEPVVREALKKAMRLIGNQFVLGETIEAAIDNAAEWAKKSYRLSYDLLGEGARSEAQAKAYAVAYHHAMLTLAPHAEGLPLTQAPSMSIKLSALHPRYSLSQHDRVMAELLPRLKKILLLAKENNIAISLDAEEANRLDIQLMVFAALLADPELAGWDGLGIAVQAYQKRALYVVDCVIELAKKHGKIIPLRLVKGAYWDSEIKHAQILGLPGYPVFTRKEHTDLSYLACADKMLEHHTCLFAQFATHNARTIASVQLLAEYHGVASERFEFQRLHGMGEALYTSVVKGHACRIYAPVGEHKDLLAYLIRRLLENGANSSFVHVLMDRDTPLGELLQDPLALSREHGAAAHPFIPLPEQLYGDRKNSRGVDLGYLALRQALEEELVKHDDAFPSFPADTTAQEFSLAISDATQVFPSWAATPVERRCVLLERFADQLEAKRSEAMALLINEAGKTMMDAVAEVREAADFCRYYARQARALLITQSLKGPTGESNELSLHPRGVFGCISPWNFPLAIFTGQIAAALVTGNTVIAKPAGQTPRIAKWAVQLMYACGIPQPALRLVCGGGHDIGARLVSDPRIAGIVFTGSVETAKQIQQSLAAREGDIVPLIAETGGINCMVVDSSVLIEQTVDDIIASAFGSAGQRCSALRVLYVQEDIADALIGLLDGAMQELRVGDPSECSTDIGPVIDEHAEHSLLGHIAQMNQQAVLIAQAPLSKQEAGHFIIPHVFEISTIRQLTRETFGPVLHVIRFKSGQLETIADDINAMGYGLTFGIQSRIDDHVALLTSRVRVGNYYINRSMIGAVVGVQPFGGERLSGTGPKAGGPHYLSRFVTERTVTTNTAAIGGNLALLT